MNGRWKLRLNLSATDDQKSRKYANGTEHFPFGNEVVQLRTSTNGCTSCQLIYSAIFYLALAAVFIPLQSPSLWEEEWNFRLRFLFAFPSYLLQIENRNIITLSPLEV
ncbi:hypothetical protein T09_13107 [Trichinella sp. T9]|nr:hypothetical protein T09_13107 [Trichinella sp. T9]